MRVNEALALTWSDVDLARGVIRLDTNKTDDPRSWALGGDVTRALGAWHKLRGAKAKKVPRIFPHALIGPRWPLARALRDGLELAGVKRPELTVAKEGRRILRAHDLRGSFVTLALAAGHTEAWVTDRTGHRSSQMIYMYKRAARTTAELALGWFAPLDEAIPELAPKPRQGANGVQTGGQGGRPGPVPGSRSDKPADIIRGHEHDGEADVGGLLLELADQRAPLVRPFVKNDRIEAKAFQKARNFVLRARPTPGVEARELRGFSSANTWNKTCGVRQDHRCNAVHPGEPGEERLVRESDEKSSRSAEPRAQRPGGRIACYSASRT